MNEIKIYQNNSKTIKTNVEGITLDGYTAILTAKSAVASTGVTFSIVGTIIDDVITFEVLPEHTADLVGIYNYDITIENGVNNYTIIQSKIIISDSVRW